MNLKTKNGRRSVRLVVAPLIAAPVAAIVIIIGDDRLRVGALCVAIVAGFWLQRWERDAPDARTDF